MIMSRSVRQAVGGPLAPFEAAFRVELARVGYGPSSIRAAVRAMARLSGWLEDRALSPGGLAPQVLAEIRIAGLGPVLRFPREAGAVPAAGFEVDVTQAEAVLAAFRRWLAGERGLSPATVRSYGKQARTFLAGLPEPLDEALRGLGAGQVTAFMLDCCRDRNTGSAKAMVTAAPALLRFLHVAGRVPVLLAAAVPSVAGWRLASSPRGLDAAVVQRLLEGCDRDTIVGRRDYAILIVLARLGLRGAEAAALDLADLDWLGGEVGVRGKGNRVERLPLPVDVGEALAGYVAAGRPRCDSAALFCTVRAPHPGGVARQLPTVMFASGAGQASDQRRIVEYVAAHAAVADRCAAKASTAAWPSTATGSRLSSPVRSRSAVLSNRAAALAGAG
jgi:site-specific recombinase XerC